MEKTLEADRKRLRRWIQNEGVVICEEPEILDLAQSLIKTVTETFPGYIPECVQDFYIYRCSEQPEGLQIMDGISWRDHTPDAGDLYSIGLSMEALERGMEYATMICLHELCHVLCDIAEIGGSNDHDERFHSILDGLIERFNARTGLQVKNDYFGIGSHFDDRKSH